MIKKIPVIILAGGFGTRISEETENKPKPMVLIGDKPILWHIMNIYASQGFTNFIITTGYKHEVIDCWVDENNQNKLWGFDCNVKVLDTGLNTQTSGRVSKAIKEVDSDLFMLTYGDGVGNINLKKLLNFHLNHGKIATVTSVRPPARFGVITSKNGVVTHFGEKNQADSGWINGGFFVINREIENYALGESMPLEKTPMSLLVSEGELMTFKHEGFWQPMDTLREKELLVGYLGSMNIPWMDYSNF